MSAEFTKGRTLAALAVFATLCTPFGALTQESDKPIVNNFVFAMPQHWFLIPGNSEGDDTLIFRRYSVAMHKADFDDLRSGRSETANIIGEAGLGSMRFRGEYMTGDLFVDADATNGKFFLSLIESSELTVEFGTQNDRLNLFVGDRLVKTNLKDFMLNALPIMLDAKNLKHFTNQEMMDRCISYKKTGKRLSFLGFLEGLTVN